MAAAARRRMAAAAAALLLATAAASAQQVTLVPTAAERCLVPTADRRGAPEYPFSAFKHQSPGRVKMQLSFADGVSPPAVTVLETEGMDGFDGDFIQAVKTHVADYRVPCLGRDEAPARLNIDFVFTPDRRKVTWSEPVDPQGAEKLTMLKCVQHETGRGAPEYPKLALRRNLQGRVVARLRFVAADQPPLAEVYSRPAGRLLAHEIRDWVGGYRMPCHTGESVQSDWSFVFSIASDSFGFKPLTLPQFLGLVKGIRQQRLQFDFGAMDCPFELKLVYRQPYLPNSVGEIGPVVAARRPFLDWLSQVELDLPERALDSVFGDRVTLPVPCTKIDLIPKE